MTLAAAAEMALDPRNDTVYDRMTFSSTATPDYDDPHWVEKIDDWEGFWYGTEEDELALQLDEDMTPGERSEASLERAREWTAAPGNRHAAQAYTLCRVVVHLRQGGSSGVASHPGSSRVSPGWLFVSV